MPPDTPTDVAGERDRALRRIQALATAIRNHEQKTRRNLASRGRAADLNLYRRLRQVSGGSDDQA